MNKKVILLSVLIAAFSIVLSVIVDLSLIKFPLIAVSVGSGIFAIQGLLTLDRPVSFSHRQSIVIDYAILGGIVSIIYSANSTSLGVPWIFYLISISTSTLLAVRILLGESQPKICLTEIILLGVAIRVSFYYSYPVYGQDLFHLGATRYIFREGSIIPSQLTYYHYYPITHIMGATTAMISGLIPKQGLFIAGGVVQVLSYNAIYLIGQKIGYEQRISVLLVLVVAVSGAPLNIGSEVMAQTLAGGVFVLIFWLLVRQSLGPRLFFCLLLLYTAAFLSHHIIVALIVSVLAIQWVIATISRRSIYLRAITNNLSTPPLGVILITLIGASYYWIFSQYLRYQVHRLITIFSITSGTGSEAVNPTGAAPSVTLMSDIIPPVVQWAGPMLVLVAISTLSGLTLLSNISDHHNMDTSTAYVIFALIVFSNFALMYAIGGQGPLSRVFPAVTVLTIPLVGYILSNQQRGISVAVIVVILIVGVSTAGLLSPGVAIPNRTADSFTPVGSTQDIAALSFAEKYATHPVTDGYLTSVSLWYGSKLGTSPVNGVISPNYQGRDGPYESISNGSDFIYRASFKDTYLFGPPQSHKYYDNGKTMIYKI